MTEEDLSKDEQFSLTCYCLLDIAKELAEFDIQDLCGDEKRIQEFQLLLLEFNTETNIYFEQIAESYKESLDGTES